MSFMSASCDGLRNTNHFIVIFMGPMKSGKSLQLAIFASKYGKNTNILAIKPKIDTTSSEDEISSRAGLFIECISVERLSDVEGREEFSDADIILIDESQFFPDLQEHVLKWRLMKSYVLGSLDADDQQRQFGQVWSLIPYARKVKKLTAVCEICNDGTLSIATISVKNKGNQIEIDDRKNSQYRSVCERHITNRT
jgi:thymidine kinase